MLSTAGRRGARASLIAVWLLTAAASLFGGEGQVLLAAAGVASARQLPLIVAGAGLDLLLGLALWRWHRRSVYLACGLAMLLLTLVATALLPALWLDPLGCLLKNLPIAALLYLLHEDAPA